MADSTNIRELIKQEYKKCAIDPAHFMTKYCVIQHPIQGKIPFRLHQYQRDALDSFLHKRYNIVLKGRQIGLSTLVAGYSVWLMLFHSDKNILILATKQDTAKNLVTKIKVMHDGLPVWLRGQIIEDNKLQLKFKNGSQVKAVSSSPASARSEALSLLVLDECVSEETKITIRNKVTLEKKEITIGEFFEMI